MRVLTGIQASGKLHIGNYFGAMKPMVELQEEHELFTFIANYHSLTTSKDAETLRQYTTDAAVDYLSLGIDPNKTTFWVQSHVPEVLELYWILSKFTPMGLLERAHSYKDKVFIFTERCTFVWAELMKEPVKIAETVGCVANQSVVEFEGKLVWLDRSGVCQFNGSTLKNISHKKMNPYLESMTKSAAVKACGMIYNRQYWLSLPTDSSTKNNVILVYDFDIEEWFHILDNDSTKTEKEWSNYEYRLDANMDRIFELLERKNQKATFFCLGWVAREFPHILKKIDEMGFEIATHSDKHQLAIKWERQKIVEL